MAGGGGLTMTWQTREIFSSQRDALANAQLAGLQWTSGVPCSLLCCVLCKNVCGVCCAVCICQGIVGSCG